MNVIWLLPARLDLEDIERYYAEVAGKSVADKIMRKVVKSSLLLQHNPYLGHISSLDNSGELLEWVIPNTHYILPYSVIDDEIRIYRVFDARQEPVDSWDE